MDGSRRTIPSNMDSCLKNEALLYITTNDGPANHHLSRTHTTHQTHPSKTYLRVSFLPQTRPVTGVLVGRGEGALSRLVRRMDPWSGTGFHPGPPE